MIVEMRSYDFVPGGVARFMALYETKGLALQTRVLGNLLGYFTTEIGPLNRTVHLWGYDSLAERERRRAALMAEAEWRGFLAEILPLLVRQESTLLTPTGFSPIR